jgi:acetyl-CoA acetyltransferase
MLVNSGLAEYVAVFRALNGRSGQRVGRARDEGPASALRYATGLVAYPQVVALCAKRYMAETGSDQEDLAAVPMAQRAWAAQNPRALVRDPLTYEEYLESPLITDPFHLVDCTIEVDGAAAVLVTTLERARDLARPPAVIQSSVYVAPRGVGLDMADMAAWPDWSRNYTLHLANELWGWAGFGAEDVDIAEIYDCFSSTVLFALEGLGFVGRGEAGAFIRSGATLPNGQLPTNTHGGLLCEGYLHGMNTLTEAVQQIQGLAANRQVAGAETAVVTSGALSDGSALILSRDRP